MLHRQTLLLALTLALIPTAAMPSPAAHVALAPESAAAFANLAEAALDDPAAGRIPNYLRALAVTHPASVRPFAQMVKSVLFEGSVASETKAAMGLVIAKETGSRYLAAHLTRVLRRSDVGRAHLASLEGGPSSTEPVRIALRYAVDLTRAVHGVSDAEFARARAVYNDAQLVELTAVTCFFNHFARFCQGAGLPVEAWAKELPNGALPAPKAIDESARVTLASDPELQMAVRLVNPSPEVRRGLGIGVANSQRAMLRAPEIGEAWWNLWRGVRENTKLTRETMLQVSLAVSTVNGCRYCVVHQVVGLRRLGVEPAKLLALKKDDTALSLRERAAVTFARKLTKTPGAVRAADFAALRTGLESDLEAMDVLLQTCAFNFMNRFTDGLRLPSEDEAIKVYQEVYGAGSYHAFPNGVKASRAARP